jgi:membrane dipeptidase
MTANDSVLMVDFSKNVEYWQTDIPRLLTGQVAAQFWSVYIPCSYQGKDAVRATLEQIDVVHKMSQAYPTNLVTTYTSQNIKDNFANSKISSLIGIEGAHQIDGSLGALRMMYLIGARYMTLTHTCNNAVADSANNLCANDADCRAGTCVNDTCSEPQTEGISDFGKIVLSEMNRLGMIIDISHVSVPAMLKALEYSKAPVIFSHSNARALCDHVRNVPDEVLLELQKNGGVIMIVFVSNFINCSNSASAAQVIDHMKYIATGECPTWKPDCNEGNFTGIGFDHIGLGSDFDGATYFPPDLDSVDDFLSLTESMLQVFTEENTAKILGGNILRVIEKVEEVANSNEFPYETMIFPDESCRSPYRG